MLGRSLCVGRAVGVRPVASAATPALCAQRALWSAAAVGRVHVGVSSQPFAFVPQRSFAKGKNKGGKGKDKDKDSDDSDEAVVEVDEGEIIAQAEEGMEKGLEWLAAEFAKIRIGRLTPDMLDGVMVQHGGKQTKLKAVTSIRVQDAHSLVLNVIESSLAQKVQDAVRSSNMGLTVSADSQGRLVVTMPRATKETKDQAAKQAQKLCEQAKVTIRHSRQKPQALLKELKKTSAKDVERRVEEKLVALVETYIKKATTMLQKKEAEFN